MNTVLGATCPLANALSCSKNPEAFRAFQTFGAPILARGPITLLVFRLLHNRAPRALVRVTITFNEPLFPDKVVRSASASAFSEAAGLK